MKLLLDSSVRSIHGLFQAKMAEKAHGYCAELSKYTIVHVKQRKAMSQLSNAPCVATATVTPAFINASHPDLSHARHLA
jgi:hypothetical protein